MRIGRPSRVFAPALWLAWVVLAAAPGDATGCAGDDRYAGLASLAGTWQIFDGTEATGEAQGASQARLILGGCALEEVRTLRDGTEERALIVVDPVTGQWRQHWASSLGHTGSFTIERAGPDFVLEGAVHTFEGERVLARATLEALETDGYVGRVELSSNDGVTFELASTTRYSRAGSTTRAGVATQPAPAPAPRPAPVPAPRPEAPAPSAPEPALPGDESGVDERPTEPAPVVEVPAGADLATGETAPAVQPPADEAASGVRVRSERKRQERIDALEMETPMTLEVELGPLDALPPGSAWRTTELGRFIADRVNIPLLAGERRQRRGKTELVVTVHLRTTARGRKVDLEATLTSADEVVATETAGGIALGKLIGSHDSDTGRPFEVRFQLEPEAFAGLFEGSKRPSVRLTIDVE